MSVSKNKRNLSNKSSGSRNKWETAIARVDRCLLRIKPFDAWLRERPRSEKDILRYRSIIQEFRDMREQLEA
jgi:hypothetical protein